MLLATAGGQPIRDGIRSIVHNGRRLMDVQWIETALSALYFAVMARCLGPALYGHWAYGIAAYMLVVGLLGFGFDTLVMLRIGRDRRAAGEFVGAMLTLRLALLIFDRRRIEPEKPSIGLPAAAQGPVAAGSIQTIAQAGIGDLTQAATDMACPFGVGPDRRGR